jgi:putative ABC transport system permease protein
MWRFAWQNLMTRPARTLLAALGLTLPIMATLGLFSLTSGIRSLMGDTLSKLNGLMVMRAGAFAPVVSDLPANLAPALSAIPGVRLVAPELWRFAPPIEGRNELLKAAAGSIFGAAGESAASFGSMIMIEGETLPEHLKLRGGAYKQSILPADQGGGRYLQLTDLGQPHVVISKKIAQSYPNDDGTPKKAGDQIKIGGKPFQIVGLYETGSFLIDNTIVMDVESVRKLYSLDDRTVSAYYIEPDDGIQAETLIERINQSVPGLKVQSTSQFNSQFGGIMSRLDLFLLLTVALAAVVGGVGVANTMLTSAMERVVEFGVMRANGWTRRNILSLVTAESTLLGVISSVIGSTLAIAGLFALNRWISGLGLKLELTPGLLIASNAAAIAVATLSGIYPAWRASRMTPMNAIRNDLL